ncbi:MAG: ABC transporter substrate-binding protein [Lachnospiraceae bacterium]|nr:ABC transporter substrate-binding protein [Lachnospiraceae bacterium]
MKLRIKRINRKNGKNRISSVLLAAAFLCLFGLCLPGCGVNTGGQGAEDGVIKLRVVTYDNGNVPLDAKEVIAAANEVSKEKIGVTVDLEFQPTEKINLMMASGEYYDMVFTSSWLNKFDKNASAGLYHDITETVKEETPALYDLIGEYWDCVKIDGRIYGVPTLKDMGTENLFRLNADYFETEKGMEIPEQMTFENIEPFLAAYKEDHPQSYPLAMDKGGLPGYLNFLERIVGGIVVIPYDQDTEKPVAIPFWECEELMNRYRLLHKWYKAGYIHPDAATIDSTVSDKSIPVRIGVAWRGYQGYSNPDDWGFNVKTSVYDGPYISRTSEQGAIFSICAACDDEHVTACLKYLELLSTDRHFRDILGYGIEGKHFEYLENGTVYRLKAGVDRYNTKLYQTGSVVNASVESASRTFLADPDQWEKVFEGYKTYGICSRTQGFAYDPTPKEDIITALTAIYNDYSTELCTGTSDPDEVMPEITRRMKAAGIDELLEDINSKLDEWVK